MSANFYELLKYAATGQASPSMTYYDKLRASTLMGGVVKTLTGQPPLTFKADGTPLISWSMKGNGSQSGTPTPDNPVMPEFVGVRTNNLCPPISSANGWIIGYRNATNGNYTSNNGQYEWLSPFFDLSDFGSSFTISADKSKAPDSMSVYYYNGNTYIASQSSTNYNGSIFDNIPNGTTRFCFAIRATAKNEAEQIASGWRVWLNAGSSALPYEPYGQYKIPLTCAGQTTSVYLGQTQTVRRIKKLVLTGEEKYKKNGSTATDYLYHIKQSELIPQAILKTPIVCSHLNETESPPTGKKIGINTNNNWDEVYLNFGEDIMNAQTSGNTVAGIKEYVASEYAAGHPVTVWYVLATEQTGIVNEPLAKIGDYADELSSEDAAVTIPTSKGSNTLTVETPIQPSEMTITYKG